MKRRPLGRLVLASWIPAVACYLPVGVTPGLDDIWCDGERRQDVPVAEIGLDAMTSRGETPRAIYARVVGQYEAVASFDLFESTLESALDDAGTDTSSLAFAMPDDTEVRVQRALNYDCEDDLLLPLRATWRSEALGIHFDVLGSLRVPTHDSTNGMASVAPARFDGGGWGWGAPLAFESTSSIRDVIEHHGYDPDESWVTFVAHLDGPVALPDDWGGELYSWSMTVTDRGAPPGPDGHPTMFGMRGEIAPGSE